MSLILDALKRAERERGAQAASGLPELSPVSLAAPPGKMRWVVIGGALVIVAGVGGWRYFKTAPDAKTETVVLTPPAPAPSQPAVVAPPPIAAPARPIAGTEEVASFDEVTGPEDAQPLESPIAPSPPPAVATPVPAPAAPAPAAVPRNKNPVRLNDTPPAYRAAFPVFTIQVHSYDRNPAARFVRVDGYRYVDGETLPSGPKIVEIIENGLILDWQNERVIYPLN